MVKLTSILLLAITLFLTSCKEDHLPILGVRTVEQNVRDGKTVIDTIYQTIPAFRFTDQDNTAITNETFNNKIYITDFVFLSCETICPKMNVQMKRLHDEFLNDSNVFFLSHTIDPEHDSIARIKLFTEANKVKTEKWHFVRASEDSIYDIAIKGYLSTAYKDSAGDYVHDGGMILVDKKRRVRGVYDGTQSFTVDQLIKDIHLLEKEKN